MASPSHAPPLDWNVRSLLAGVRWRIRAYVIVQGVAVCLLWLAATFVLAVGFDYFFVLMGSSELPWMVRGVVLLGIFVGVGYLLYRFIVRRIFVPLKDTSMAVVLERKYDGFADSLLTAVELAEQPSHADDFNEEMLHRSRDIAQEQARSVRLGRVFNLAPLGLTVLALIVIGGGIGAFAAIAPDLFMLAAKRTYLLSTAPWPRYAQIEVVGIEVSSSTRGGESTTTKMVPFENGVVRVAEGSSVSLVVKSDTNKAVTPNTCMIYYRTSDGIYDQAPMETDGAVRDGHFQFYNYGGRPFRDILGDISFDVLGYDDRIRGYAIEVVEKPTLVAMLADCEFPEYMVDEKNALWLPRTIDLQQGVAEPLPLGANVTLRCTANKQLETVTIFDATQDRTTTLSVEGKDSFVYESEALEGDLLLQVTLEDVDGVITESPIRIFAPTVEDGAPRIDVLLRGIGSAVTPRVMIPVEGTIVDDYGLNRVWFEAMVGDIREEFAVTMGPGNQVKTAPLDFDKLTESKKTRLKLTPGVTLGLAINASDRYDLGASPNVGVGDVYELEVVTAEELSHRLEVREVGFRKRLELIIEELAQTRSSLAKVDEDSSSIKLEPGDEPNDAAADQLAVNIRNLRLLRVQQGNLQGEKSMQEVLGLARAFDDIRLEMVNNRIDKEDQKLRLEENVVAPLNRVGNQMFPELVKRLEALQKAIDDDAARPAATEKTVEQVDDILTKLDDVLQELIEIEDLNAIIEVVRALIEEENELIERTRKARTKGLLD